MNQSIKFDTPEIDVATTQILFMRMKVTTSVDECCTFGELYACMCVYEYVYAGACMCLCASKQHMEVITLKLFVYMYRQISWLFIWQNFIQICSEYEIRSPMQYIECGNSSNVYQRIAIRFNRRKFDLFTFCVWRFTCQLTVCSAQFANVKSNMSRFV